MVKPLVSGIIGAGVAAAVIIGIIFVMPQLTSEQQPSQRLSSSTSNDNNDNNPTTAQTTNPNEPYGELRQQDAAFDNFYSMMDDCISPPLTAAEQASKPSPITCRQTIQHGMTTWCGAGENYNAEKCDAVNFLTRMYDETPKF